MRILFLVAIIEGIILFSQVAGASEEAKDWSLLDDALDHPIAVSEISPIPTRGVLFEGEFAPDSRRQLDRALYLLAINFPEVHDRLVSEVTDITYDPYYQGAAGIIVFDDRAEIVFGPCLLNGFYYPPERLAAVLGHEAYHLGSRWRGVTYYDEVAAKHQELVILEVLGASAWKQEREVDLKEYMFGLTGRRSSTGLAVHTDD